MTGIERTSTGSLYFDYFIQRKMWFTIYPRDKKTELGHGAEYSSSKLRKDNLKVLYR